ncbi:glucuronate isomerase [Alishewanella sp. SMS8]|uniref:glucuronate isomerase n=1 Tax=Alishewanella sp. SMS8 TaxID=2994676 RepID=UPI002741197C|nr:glucuronate isomerase [Alishewanella sp. SMS8]MDP5206592.1 glucuronate isomerase [Alishewanella sp. SMS9]MDP5458495.1 glucuronate isomerase [Alishewanella sp. SMS8]
MAQTFPLELHPDRLFPADPVVRAIAQRLYAQIKDLPIVSPHGHTDPRWFADDANFENATALLLLPDHYVFRMLYSQGIKLESLGIRRKDGAVVESDYRKIFHIFAKYYYLFRSTPSRIWLDTVFHDVFGLKVTLTEDTADLYYDTINEQLAKPEFKPRALLGRFNIELIATTEGALNDLRHHAKLKGTGFEQNVITTFRPDDVVDADRADFAVNVAKLGELTGEDTSHWQGYLQALRIRRAFFREHGATATDHGHPSAITADLPEAEAAALFQRCLAGTASMAETELFRGQMLTEMAGMSLQDGMTMQIHPGAHRNHNQMIFERFGPDKGADIPSPTEFVSNLKPLLQKYGNEAGLNIILFTLDETTYARELAPLAGHYPALKLGPAWWFHDSPEGMLRFRHQVTETAGFYNTVGFNDDTRAFLSIPARHDVARRIDCRFLAGLVAEHRLTEAEAGELAYDLTYGLVKKAYQLK